MTLVQDLSFNKHTQERGRWWMPIAHQKNQKKLQPGYRVLEFHNVPAFNNPKFPGTSTHWCRGNWEVLRVEEYPMGTSESEFEMVVICYCQYALIQAELKPIKRMESPQSVAETVGVSGG